MSTNRQKWLNKCLELKDRWDIFGEQPLLNNDSKGINIYRFLKSLNENLKDNSIVVSDAGSSYYCCGQALKLKNGCRWIVSSSQGELGSGIGIATGVSFAKDKQEVILTIGDGSFQTNINQLAVIKKYQLPIKIFIWNNSGYLTNRNTLNKFYEGRLIGTGPENELWFPDIKRMATGYEIDYLKIDKIINLDATIKEILSINKPIICEVICPKEQEIIPTAYAARDENGKLVPYSLSKMYPLQE
jgi:acetolactate synthase-1/2/3 large subunit